MPPHHEVEVRHDEVSLGEMNVRSRGAQEDARQAAVVNNP